jgi:hypothetical protein
MALSCKFPTVRIRFLRTFFCNSEGSQTSSTDAVEGGILKKESKKLVAAYDSSLLPATSAAPPIA